MNTAHENESIESPIPVIPEAGDMLCFFTPGQGWGFAGHRYHSHEGTTVRAISRFFNGAVIYTNFSKDKMRVIRGTKVHPII